MQFVSCPYTIYEMEITKVIELLYQNDRRAGRTDQSNGWKMKGYTLPVFYHERPSTSPHVECVGDIYLH